LQGNAEIRVMSAGDRQEGLQELNWGSRWEQELERWWLPPPRLQPFGPRWAEFIQVRSGRWCRGGELPRTVYLEPQHIVVSTRFGLNSTGACNVPGGSMKVKGGVAVWHLTAFRTLQVRVDKPNCQAVSETSGSLSIHTSLAPRLPLDGVSGIKLASQLTALLRHV